MGGRGEDRMKLQPLPITITAAKQFISVYHRHNKPPQGALFALSAGFDGNIVGVAVVGRPVARHFDDKFTAEVTRCCVIDGAPKGTCSFLYQSAWRAARELGWRRMITYTLQSENGASLRGAGWKIIAERKGKSASGWTNRPGRSLQEVVSEPKFLWSAV